LVSRDSSLPKVELMVAANPKNANNLVGTAIAATPFTEVCTVYASFDGGSSWKTAAIPGLPESGSGDPQVAFVSDGTAYFSALVWCGLKLESRDSLLCYSGRTMEA